jgi:hypothetical protein
MRKKEELHQVLVDRRIGGLDHNYGLVADGRGDAHFAFSIWEDLDVDSDNLRLQPPSEAQPQVG